MHRFNFCFVSVCLAIAFGTATAFGQNNAPSDRYIVTVAPGNDPAQVAAAHGLNPRHVYSRALHGFAAQVPPGQLAALANDARVAGVSIDHPVFAFAKPTPPPPPPPAGQVLPAGVSRIGANTVAQTGAGIGVAILDTGLDFNHSDLPISPTSFVSPDFAYYTTTAQDDAGHGTHVGGIVAAKNNNIDVVGVAPNAILYAVKVLDNTGSGYDSDIAAGLDWVRANATAVVPPIRVINMSLGRGASVDDSVMHQAIANVVAAGVVVVVAAGNDASVEVSQTVPAGFPEVIAVASTTAKAGTSSQRRYAPIQADTASYFTTDGKFDPLTGIGVAISAPGEDQENIAFPYINSVGILSTALGGGTTRLSGTSMAAPHAAGVVALLLEKAPALTPVEVKTRIMSGDRELVAPLNSPTSSYSFDGEREGILSAPIVLNF
jgi:subtilisin